MRWLGVVLGCAVLAQGQVVRFADRAKAGGLSGVVMRHEPTKEKHLIETMPGGVAAFDFDNDGFPDLYFTNGADGAKLAKQGEAHWNRLYRNQGDGTFRDVTAAAGVQGTGYDMAAATGDFDNDGLADLFVAGVGANTLYRNLGGGKFEDVTKAAGMARAGQGPWAVAAGWFDFDNDGLLDLFVVNYLDWKRDAEPFCGDQALGFRVYCHPKYYGPLPNQIYRNLGGGKFADVSKETGLSAHLGKGMGVAFGDADGDGDLDAFVTNDTLPNFLFVNEGGKRFREAALEMGVAYNDDGVAVSSMGVDFRDFDNDGRDDVIITALANETFPFFRNLGKGLFQDVTRLSLVARFSLDRSGWSVGIYDFNNDGWKDIFVANGDVQDNAELYSSRRSRQANSLWINQRNGKVADSGAAAGFDRVAIHRGSAFADFDRDGRVDIAVTALGEPPSLLRNETAQAGHWLALRLEGTRSNRLGIGARVRVVTSAGEQWNQQTTSVGYASASEPVVHFGLGKDTAASLVEIRWPSGVVQTLKDVSGDRYLSVREPRE
jgi:hypothetical protein